MCSQAHAHSLERMNIDSPYVVETRALTKRFGDRTVVRDVELRVPRGVAFGYLGPNGAGKTTLIRMLLGLTGASAGSMKVLGLPVPDRRGEALARVGAIVDEPRFHGHLTGRENLGIVAAARGREAFGRIDDALGRVGMTKRADDRVQAYSMGMRQRLGIARALLGDPELLILDEPMNGLDPAGIREFRALIRSFVDEGRTVVLSSHLLDEVERTCDQAAIVDRGRIVAQGSLDELRGHKPLVRIATDDQSGASTLLSRAPGVLGLAHVDGELDVSLADDDVIPELNRLLVTAGISVKRLEPAQASLEQRFMEITTRLEEAS
jgi:ABC-2 type transport system ATP-binding protein